MPRSLKRLVPISYLRHRGGGNIWYDQFVYFLQRNRIQLPNHTIKVEKNLTFPGFGIRALAVLRPQPSVCIKSILSVLSKWNVVSALCFACVPCWMASSSLSFPLIWLAEFCLFVRSSRVGYHMAALVWGCPSLRSCYALEWEQGGWRKESLQKLRLLQASISRFRRYIQKSI